jgi:hypothetical protein
MNLTKGPIRASNGPGSGPSSVWIVLGTSLCVLLYAAAYFFTGLRTNSLNRAILVAIPSHTKVRETAYRENTKANWARNGEGLGQAGSLAYDAGEDIHDYGDYEAYEDPNADAQRVKCDTPYPVHMTARTDDDILQQTETSLDEALNPDLTPDVHLNPDWIENEFDRELLSLQGDHVVLHQTWKDACVLKTKTKYMKSWKNEPNLRVVFWTDELMEKWVKERFEGTDIYDAWGAIGTTMQATIKKADLFRAMVIWYYGGVYADLDIELKESIHLFLEHRETVLVWEPEDAMAITNTPLWGRYQKRRGARRTLILSAFLISGRRYSDFLGYYINWIVANTLSGRSKYETHVLDATGPIAEAEAYWYYTGRLGQHDRLLRVLSYPEFLHYGEHYSETTWVAEAMEGIGCVDVHKIHPDVLQYTVV